jgi:hypothetical protein
LNGTANFRAVRTGELVDGFNCFKSLLTSGIPHQLSGRTDKISQWSNNGSKVTTKSSIITRYSKETQQLPFSSGCWVLSDSRSWSVSSRTCPHYYVTAGSNAEQNKGHNTKVLISSFLVYWQIAKYLKTRKQTTEVLLQWSWEGRLVN